MDLVNGILRAKWTVAGYFCRLICLAIVCASFGCDADRERQGLTQQRTQVSEVPQEILDSATNALPGVEFTEAWKNMDRQDKLHSYEIRGRIRSTGKIKEVRVSPTGEILEME